MTPAPASYRPRAVRSRPWRNWETAAGFARRFGRGPRPVHRPVREQPSPPRAVARRRRSRAPAPLQPSSWRSSALVLRLRRSAPFARFAAPFLDQPNGLDAHAPIDRLGHVVDGEAGHGNGGERLHLDARLADASRLGANAKAG